MINLFANDYFFYILIITLIPALIIGLAEKSLRVYGLIVTFIFICLACGFGIGLAVFAAFYLYSYLVTVLYAVLNRIITRTLKRRVIFWIFLVLSLLPLIFMKSLPGVKWFHILGVSYITFRVIQFNIDIHDGKINRVAWFDFTYFVLFFPAVASGPIDRRDRFMKDIRTQLNRSEYIALVREGLWRIAKGLLYSFVIAPPLNLLLQKVNIVETFWGYIGYAYVYTLYLFFNFAGYSALAIGTAYFLGIRMVENFNMPFLSRDLKEFWTRWHMSLSSFFRDFIYNRLVFQALKRKWFKKQRIASYIGYLVTMSLMGVWHGFALHYIAYGVYHGVFMYFNDWLDQRASFRNFKNRRIGGVLCAFVTFNIFAFSLLIFSGKLF